MTDVWGYVDQSTNTEYALVGFGLFVSGSGESGVHIVDVSDAQNPSLVATITAVAGFDVKVWKNYMYTVTGITNGDGDIVDLTDPANPRSVGTFPSAHNIFIADNGYLYSECPGLRIFDLNPDPTNPQLIWRDNTTACHDAAVIGTRLFDFHGRGGTNFYDVADPTKPRLLGAVNPPSVVFHHSGWTSEDGAFLYICDEGAHHPIADITVWDIRDVGNPKFVTDFGDSTAIVHNLYVIDDLAYVAYYTSGFRLFDISDPNRLTLVDEFDTSSQAGEQFAGAFGVYPFTGSGHIYVSDMQEGLFIFSLNKGTQRSSGITAP